MVERHEGTTRAVYLIGRWAVKVPRWRGERRWRSWRFAHAVVANLTEWQWRQVPGVVPALSLHFGGLVAIYPRCDQWPHVCEPDYDAIGPEWLPRDRKPHNVGLLNGEPVWLDYATNTPIKETP